MRSRPSRARQPSSCGGPGRVGITRGHVTRPPRHDGIGNLAPAGQRVGAHHVEHAVALAGAEVDGQRALGIEQVPQRRHVALGQVADVDVVAHAGAVGGVVVVAEDLQLRAPAHGHLRHVGHQVVGRAARVFADQAAFVRAHRVEVAQGGDLPARVAGHQVAQHRLAHQLGLAVGVGRGQRRVLGDRQLLGNAVDRRARAEHDAPAGAGLHRPAQTQNRAPRLLL